MSEENGIKIINLETLKSFLSSQDNSKNYTYLSDIPEICKNEPCLVGIDEAGRGPVLGPMVYGIAFCPIDKKDILVDLGCADSKQLTEEKRDIIFEDIHKKENAIENIGWAIEVISPNVISTSMYRRAKCSLNEVSMDSAIGLIHKIAEAGVNIAEIYVDTVGPPEKYQEKLLKIFPDYQITVAKKADSTYPIVSMASICAKVSRDQSLKVWKFPEGLNLTHEQFGSGYPGDPVTKTFLAENIEQVFGYPRLVRFSWSTAENSLQGKAFDIQFDDQEDEKSQFNAASQITNFFKGKTKDGKTKRIKHSFFKDRFIENVTDF